jgi:glycosyltransferase involved in cell wall biosynthesis
MESSVSAPLLSIVIPTYNRASYLALTLKELQAALSAGPQVGVEVLVSDNASSDNTPEIVNAAIANGLTIRSVRNPENVGSDANIAQAFNLATGRYVLILSDDDVLLPRAYNSLVRHLESGDYGVVCLRPYGYISDFNAEYPGGRGQEKIFTDAGKFLARIGPYMTLISACVIDKSLFDGIDANSFCGGNLVQVHMIMHAALRGTKCLYCTQYSVACKRNNSGGYDFSKVFVEELGKIFDDYGAKGLPAGTARKFETRMMIGYYPSYLLRQRFENSGELDKTYTRFAKRFRKRVLFWILIFPIIKMPRLLAIAWGGIVVAVGRVLTGDFRRGVTFAWKRLTRS